MTREGKHILSIEGLDVFYGGVQAVRGVSFDVAPGEILGIVGESGSGKSTVLRTVAGLLGRSGVATGKVIFDGLDLLSMPPREHARLRGHRVSYVFQNPVLSLDPLFPVSKQFDECLMAHDRAHEGFGGRRAQRSAVASYRETERSVLAEMGFSDPDRVLAARPDQLSGGECQRVVLAMSVACDTTLLLADEPTSALDVASQQQVTGLLSRIREQRGTTIVIVSHNIAAIGKIADRIGVMYRGAMVEIGARDHVLHSPSHPYTANLIAAVPRTDGSLPRIPEPWKGE
ncbi:MAG: ABC transporter ATP-binding protein [Coriobacteriia bacterium]|nr:ABC transporter ATP-binding protein [Coriobacteriia bacterium]